MTKKEFLKIVSKNDCCDGLVFNSSWKNPSEVWDLIFKKSCALDETQAVRQNEDAESNFICYHFESGNVSAKCHKPCGDRCCLAV